MCVVTAARWALRVAEERRARRDLASLRARLPALKDYGDLSDQSRLLLEPDYVEYVATVSTGGQAISLELATFLHVLCRLVKPNRLLDTGSGFSSFVFRLFQKEAPNDVEVWSADDSPPWLDKTRDFLERKNVPTENLVSWESFVRSEPDPFDLVLHDLGSTALRQESLPTATSLALPGGYLVVDDWHKRQIRSSARRALKARGVSHFSLKRLTEDQFGRYSLLVAL
jgi:predicted O-methyltransferase YrrM